MILLQYHRFNRKNIQSMKDWKGRFRTKAAESQYKEYDRLLREHFINGSNDNVMIDEILKEVTTLEDIEDATSECVLLCVHRVKTQRSQKSALNDIKEAKDFDIISQNMQK